MGAVSKVWSFAVAECSFFYPMGSFEGKEGSRSSSSIEDLISKAEYRVARWISMMKEGGNIKLNDLIFNWEACMSWALAGEGNWFLGLPCCLGFLNLMFMGPLEKVSWG